MAAKLSDALLQRALILTTRSSMPSPTPSFLVPLLSWCVTNGSILFRRCYLFVSSLNSSRPHGQRLQMPERARGTCCGHGRATRLIPAAVAFSAIALPITAAALQLPPTPTSGLNALSRVLALTSVSREIINHLATEVFQCAIDTSGVARPFHAACYAHAGIAVVSFAASCSYPSDYTRPAETMSSADILLGSVLLGCGLTRLELDLLALIVNALAIVRFRFLRLSRELPNLLFVTP